MQAPGALNSPTSHWFPAFPTDHNPYPVPRHFVASSPCLDAARPDLNCDPSHLPVLAECPICLRRILLEGLLLPILGLSMLTALCVAAWARTLFPCGVLPW